MSRAIENLADTANLATAERLLLDGADADRLYTHWFHRETGRTLHWPTPGALLAAALDPARLEAGWTVATRAAGTAGAVETTRGTDRRIVAPPQCAPAEPAGITLRPGTPILVDPIVTGAVGGFWHLWSPAWIAAPPARFVRIYVPLQPAEGSAFAGAVARLAPDARWAAKVLTGAHDAGRRDGALVFLARPGRSDRPALAALLRRLSPLATGPLPPFVRPVAGSLGWAPDPGGARSFGQAVAQALVSARDAAGSARFRTAALAAVAALAGMARPW